MERRKLWLQRNCRLLWKNIYKRQCSNESLRKDNEKVQNDALLVGVLWKRTWNNE